MTPLRQPDCVAARAAAYIQYALLVGQMAKQCPLSKLELDRAIGWIVQSVPLALAEGRVVRADTIHTTGIIHLGRRRVAKRRASHSQAYWCTTNLVSWFALLELRPGN